MARVLIVDDAQVIRDMLQTLLEGEGYTVAGEGDGDRARDAIQASSDPLVVLLDLYLRGFAENPVLRAVEADPPLAARHRFIVMTAGQEDRAAAAMAPLGASLSGLLLKPFDLRDLLAAVARCAGELSAGEGAAYEAALATVFEPEALATSA